MTGKVAFEGTAPTMERLKLDADASARRRTPSDLRAGSGRQRQRHAAARHSLRQDAPPVLPTPFATGGSRPERLPLLPHVFGIQGGQGLKSSTSDARSTHPRLAQDEPGVQHRTALQGDGDGQEFDKPECRPVQVRCPKWWALTRGLEHPFYARRGTGNLRDQEPAAGTTSSRPGTRSTARRRRASPFQARRAKRWTSHSRDSA